MLGALSGDSRMHRVFGLSWVVGAIRHRRDEKSPNVKIGLRVVLTGRRRQRAERTKLLLDCLVKARSNAMRSFNKNFSC